MKEIEEFQKVPLPPEMVKTMKSLVDCICKEKGITDQDERRKVAYDLCKNLYPRFKKHL